MQAAHSPLIVDESVVASWYSEYRKPLFRLCYSIFHNVNDADEAVQETFVKVLKNPKAFRGESAPYTYLRTIAVRVCYDRLKSFSWKVFASDGKMPESSRNQESPTAGIEREEFHEALMKGFDKLSARQKLIFSLRFYEGLSIPEIARVTGLHAGTVKRHLYRALDRLKQVGGQI